MVVQKLKSSNACLRAGPTITRLFHRVIRRRDATFAQANSLNLAGFSTAVSQCECPPAARLAQFKELPHSAEIPAEAKLKHHLSKFLSDESGATAIEYGLIAAGIALAIIAAVNGLGLNLSTQFTSINSSLK